MTAAPLHPSIEPIYNDGVARRCGHDLGTWSYQPCSRAAKWRVPTAYVRDGGYRCTQHAQKVSRRITFFGGGAA